MAKIKLTKGELKRQRDSLKQFRHYLPTLQLKKQQLQLKIFEIRKILQQKETLLVRKQEGISKWVGLLADPQLAPLRRDPLDLQAWLTPQRIEIQLVNIAGAKVPYLKRMSFKEPEYDFYLYPFWLGAGVIHLKQWVALVIEVEILKKQIATLEHELRITTQRVNLFEKVKIPECQENIRKIRIYLGDQMANAVGISKVAKGKIEKIARVEAGV
jgi:V/A-type H+-transporting ATPase subunit D